MPRPFRLPSFPSAFSSAAATTALAASLSVVSPPTAEGAGLLVAEGPFGGVFEQVDHDVTVTLNNGIATTEIEQVFRNTESRTLEALYTFPVPEDASVSNFSMWINGVEMTGEVLEKQRAREVYDAYKAQPRPKDPGLLEQKDFKTFELRIYPIFANAEQRIRLVYHQPVQVDDDWSTYTYPLAPTEDAPADTSLANRFSMSVRALSEVPIVQMESPSHPREVSLAPRGDHLHEASLELVAAGSTRPQLDRDVVFAWQTRRARTGIDLVTSRPPEGDGYFMATLTAGEDLAKLDAPMDYVFVLDVSGSMQHDAKLGMSTDQIVAFLEALGPDDRFTVIAFNDTPRPMAEGLLPTTPENLAAARRFLTGQSARGGTQLKPAVQTAFRYADDDRALNVVLLSDGMSERPETQALVAAMTQKPANATLFAVGVGTRVDRAALDRMAEATGGFAEWVSRGDDFQRRAAGFRRKLTRPLASNLAIDFGDADVYDLEPAVLPNLFHGRPVQVFGRYRNPGPVSATISANVLGRSIERKAKLTFPGRDAAAPQSPEVERMWAWTRMDQLAREGGSAAIDEIVRLGEGYSIVSEHTSFIVLENDEEYRRWGIERRNQLRQRRDGAARQALNERVLELRDEALAKIGPPVAPGSVEAAEEAKPLQLVSLDRQPPAGGGGDVDFSSAGRRSSGGGGAGAVDPLGLGLIGLALLGLGDGVRRRRAAAALGGAA